MGEKLEHEKSLADYLGSKYPPKDIPIIYADTVPVTGRGGGVIKFYLVRNDPSITADSTFNPQLVAQVVMPVTGFSAVALFFDDEVNAMVKSGELDAKKVEEPREFYRNKRAQLEQTGASKS